MTRLQTVVCLCTVIYYITFCYVESQSLRIGAFNIQVFGQKKASKTQVMDILVKIIDRYDLLLIQEIRDSKQKAIYKLLDAVNKNQQKERKFSMVLSRRLGRTHSKEQYAYMYRASSGLTITQAFEFDDGNETLNHGKVYYDLFQREPYIIKVSSPDTVPKTFVVIGIHVAPEQAVQEINALEGVFEYVHNEMRVPDVVAMGDLNADCSYVSKSDWATIRMRNDPKYTWGINDDMDTTVKSTHCSYDRFIFTGETWSRGIVPFSTVVYKYDEDLNLFGEMSKDLADDVSDHYPIEFKLQVSPTISILGAYIKLYLGSLSKNNVYYMGRGSKWLSINDANNQQVGYLREKDQAEQDLAEKIRQIIDSNLNDKPIEVVSVKRKYRDQQGIKIDVHVSIDNARIVRNTLFEICNYNKFVCT